MFADYLLKVWPFRELLIILKLISARFLLEISSSKNEEMKKKKHFHFICCTLAEPMMLMLMLKNSLAIMHRPGGLGEGEGVGHFLQSVFATIPALQPLSTVQIGHIYICTLARDCKRHILASVSTWCRYTVISFSSHHRTLQWRKKQICSSSLPIDFQIWVQIHELYSFTIYISNGQCPRLQNCMNIAHDRRLASSGKCLSSFCSQFSDVQRLLLRETKSVPGCLIIFHILCLSTTLAPPKPWPTRRCFSA